MDLNEYLAQNTFLKALVKGEPGCGKTILAAQATQVWKTKYIDTDGGIISAMKYSVNRKNLDVSIIRDQNHGAFLERIADEVADAQTKGVECLVLDHITEVASRIEEDLTEKGVDSREKFGQLLQRMMRFARSLRDLPMHTVVTAHTKPRGKEDGTSIFELAIPGQSSSTIPGYFDVVGVVRKTTEKGGKHKHLFTTNGLSVYQVRDRWRALAPEEHIDEAKPGEIWRKLHAGMVSFVSEEAGATAE